jgi:hypothetical protein
MEAGLGSVELLQAPRTKTPVRATAVRRVIRVMAGCSRGITAGANEGKIKSDNGF